MQNLKSNVIVERNLQGTKVTGYLNNELIITITNYGMNRCFEVSQSVSLIGSLEKVKYFNETINAVLDKVESLKSECEGRISIEVINCNGGWTLSIDGFNGEVDDNKDNVISLARYFKQRYESFNVIVSYKE